MIFVTGGTGFLGKTLIPFLASREQTIRVLARNPEAHGWLKRYANVEVIQGDLADSALLKAGMAGCDSVIHAGGFFRMWGDSTTFHKTNVQGTINMSRAAVANRIRRFVYVSTVAVIGNPTPGQIIDETHAPRPADPYQRSKLAAEQVLSAWIHDHGLPAIILRPGAYYGPHGRYAFNRLFFEDPIKGLLVKVNHGRHVIFPVYIGDVAAACLNGLIYGEVGQTYNICGDPLTHQEANDIVSDEAGITHFRFNAPTRGMLTLAQLWTWLSALTGVEPYYPINLRSYVFNDWQTSSQKARDELHFRPTPFRTGARSTLDWYRAQGFPWMRTLPR
jgi:dihydroflavonol-4-reductase